MAMLGQFWAGSDYLGRFRTGSGRSAWFCDGLSRSGRSGPVRDRSGGLDRFNSANRFPLSWLKLWSCRAATGSAVKLQQRGQRRRADQGYRSNPKGGGNPPSLSLAWGCHITIFFSNSLHHFLTFSLLLFPYIGERKREGCPGGIPVNKGCFGPKWSQAP